MNKIIKELLIKREATITDVLKKLKKTGLQCLIVVDKKNKYLGTITDGDIRREILKNKDFTKKIHSVYNSRSTYLTSDNFNENLALKLLQKKTINLIPIISKKGFVVNYYNIYKNSLNKDMSKEKNLVMIMAGGQGKRLQPLTSILPKPLIPVKGKPVLIHIMDLFKLNGFRNFSISINKKHKVLKSYLNELRKIYNFNYLEEESPLGTAGALKRIKNVKKTFFVVNCDNLFKINPKDLIKFHKENKNYITLVAAVKKFEIPYGVCELEKKSGKLIKMEEKPKKFVLANTGFYVCEPKVFNFLPKSKKFGMNEVIDLLQKKRKKVGIFPIKDNEWQDTGNWLNYMNIIQKEQ